MAMSQPEEDLLTRYLQSSTKYLEFGSGESTKLALHSSSIERVDSVESSQHFVEDYFEDDELIWRAIDSNRLNFHYVDIGPTKDWGIPIDKTKKYLWPNYSLSIFRRKRDYDLVLIDGRFRVACALSSMLSIPSKCDYLIHDFPVLPELFVLLNFLEIKERAGTLVAFEKRRNIDSSKAHRLIMKYQYLPQDKDFFIRIKSKIMRLLKIKR